LKKISGIMCNAKKIKSSLTQTKHNNKK